MRYSTRSVRSDTAREVGSSGVIGKSADRSGCAVRTSTRVIAADPHLARRGNRSRRAGLPPTGDIAPGGRAYLAERDRSDGPCAPARSTWIYHGIEFSVPAVESRCLVIRGPSSGLGCDSKESRSQVRESCWTGAAGPESRSDFPPSKSSGTGASHKLPWRFMLPTRTRGARPRDFTCGFTGSRGSEQRRPRIQLSRKL